MHDDRHTMFEIIVTLHTVAGDGTYLQRPVTRHGAAMASHDCTPPRSSTARGFPPASHLLSPVTHADSWQDGDSWQRTDTVLSVAADEGRSILADVASSGKENDGSHSSFKIDHSNWY
jgi:hypothetical protein